MSREQERHVGRVGSKRAEESFQIYYKPMINFAMWMSRNCEYNINVYVRKEVPLHGNL